jgi:hypothetical protein
MKDNCCSLIGTATTEKMEGLWYFVYNTEEPDYEFSLDV